MKSIEWFKVNSKDKKGFPIILNVVLLKNPNYPDVFTCPFELEEVITIDDNTYTVKGVEHLCTNPVQYAEIVAVVVNKHRILT